MITTTRLALLALLFLGCTQPSEPVGSVVITSYDLRIHDHVSDIIYCETYADASGSWVYYWIFDGMRPGHIYDPVTGAVTDDWSTAQYLREGFVFNRGTRVLDGWDWGQPGISTCTGEWADFLVCTWADQPPWRLHTISIDLEGECTPVTESPGSCDIPGTVGCHAP